MMGTLPGLLQEKLPVLLKGWVNPVGLPQRGVLGFHPGDTPVDEDLLPADLLTGLIVETRSMEPVRRSWFPGNRPPRPACRSLPPSRGSPWWPPCATRRHREVGDGLHYPVEGVVFKLRFPVVGPLQAGSPTLLQVVPVVIIILGVALGIGRAGGEAPVGIVDRGDLVASGDAGVLTIDRGPSPAQGHPGDIAKPVVGVRFGQLQGRIIGLGDLILEQVAVTAVMVIVGGLSRDAGGTGFSYRTVEEFSRPRPLVDGARSIGVGVVVRSAYELGRGAGEIANLHRGGVAPIVVEGFSDFLGQAGSIQVRPGNLTHPDVGKTVLLELRSFLSKVVTSVLDSCDPVIDRVRTP